MRSILGGILTQDADRVSEARAPWPPSPPPSSDGTSPTSARQGLSSPDGARQVPAIRVVTKRQPTAEEWTALRFAWRVCAHVKSNSVIFTTANRTLKAIHDRMPVVVPPEAFDLWLDTTNVDARTAEALITPAPDNLLEAYPISADVNRTVNDNPKLLEPLAAGAEPAPAPKPSAKRAPAKAKKDSGQGALF